MINSFLLFHTTILLLYLIFTIYQLVQIYRILDMEKLYLESLNRKESNSLKMENSLDL